MLSVVLFIADGKQELILCDLLTLTLTLSLREREQPSAAIDFSGDGPTNPITGLSKRQRTIPPLPEGVGRGEGQGGAMIAAIQFSV